MITIKLSKEELCKKLGVKSRTLKDIENKNQLKDRLQQKGFTLVDKTKEGRQVFYILEEQNNNKELYNNMIKYVYNTSKEEEFTKYFTLRTLENDNIVLSKGDIASKTEVSTRTITTWDNKLINLNIISKDGYFYFCIDKNKQEIKQCSKEEYKAFWRNIAYIGAFKDLQLKYINGVIDLNQLTLASAEIGASVALINDKYYYRIKKYKTNDDNNLYIDTMNLIKNIYGNKKIEFKVELLE